MSKKIVVLVWLWFSFDFVLEVEKNGIVGEAAKKDTRLLAVDDGL